MEKQNHYFDYAASTPLDPRVLAVMLPYFDKQFANPSSLYAAGRSMYRDLELARQYIASWMGAKKSEIIFTSGATESINLAILGSVAQYPGSSLIVSAIEHSAVLQAAKALTRNGHKLAICPVDNFGLVSVEALREFIDDSTVIVSVALANNEIGTIQPIAAIAQMISKVRTSRAERGINLPIYLHTDASAAAPLLNIQVSRLGIDLLTLNGAKVYGPKISAVLYVRAGTRLQPFMYGGGQERGLRPGTESVADAVGLAEALRIVADERVGEVERLTVLRDNLYVGLKKAIPSITLNGHPTHRLGSSLNITIPSLSGEDAVYYLDEAGIQLATGSACTASDDQPSHVLLALGLSPDNTNSSLRISLGRHTTDRDTSALIQAFSKVVIKLAGRS